MTRSVRPHPTSTSRPILLALFLVAGCGARTDLEPSALGSGEPQDGGRDATSDRLPPPEDVDVVDVFSEGFDDTFAGDVFFDDGEGVDSSFPEDGGDGGSECPGSTAGFTPMTYTPAVAGQGVCTSTQIQAFITACGDTGTESSCNAWTMANFQKDGGASNPCAGCIFAPDENGGVWTDPTGYFEPNYAACIQLTDKTHGPTCAPAYDDLQGCVGVACDTCTTDSSYTHCVTSVGETGGGCATYQATEETACKADLADGGAASTCSPGAATMTEDPDFEYIITLICGAP